MSIADKILLLRKQKGWTQAIAAKHIAIQQSYLSKIENGQYQPSADVIEKLCQAYQVSAKELLPETSTNRAIVWVVNISALTGLTLVVLGYFSLIFSQTYYTYKTVPIQNVTEQLQTSYYHVTDEYLGDNYVKMISSIQYEYSLMTARDISRKENRWLIALGCILIFSSIIIHLEPILPKSLFKKSRPHQ